VTCHKPKDYRFLPIGAPNRIWCISAIHGDFEKLAFLHDQLFPHVENGDRILYHGNYIGFGPSSAETIDELLTFRRAVMADNPGMLASDIIYLRGAQEEMWQKLMQLQFAPNPQEVLIWMLGNGLSNTLYSYGIDPHDGMEACRQGMISIGQWTNHIKAAIKSRAAHETFMTQLFRAAYSENYETSMLFVNAGLDARIALEEQGDNFWWAHKEFECIHSPYLFFKTVVRGYDPSHKGLNLTRVASTIDGGCGFGGSLVCACFDEQAEILDVLEC
tara:strand:- start:403 stop:1224 length:822 start_codon:yes stop_codon:yes gene_type:complete